ncbi:MAG: GDSL-type esterase/lipase family protein [Planctomycetota bacterium]
MTKQLRTTWAVSRWISGAVSYGATIVASAAPDLYEAPGRVVEVAIDLTERSHKIPREIFGVNLSYFNDTDEIWAEHGIADSLRRAGVGGLRYPGGEETSFFHWRHPGVNGYEDIHDDAAVHGEPRRRGRFQTTWVHPDQWGTNDRFMSFDEYMAHCEAIGAEPFVGINMSCGRAHGRMDEGVAEAVELVRNAKERWGGVRYWFLDNEPWHGKAAYTFDIEREYVPDVIRYSRAMKAIDPNVEIIVNPFSAESYNHRDFAARVIQAMGDDIDHVDVHWYPGWGVSSWAQWAGTSRMNTGTRWKPVQDHRGFLEDFELLWDIFTEAGRPDLGLMALEWNIGPNESMFGLSSTAFALMHAEILMTFVEGGLGAASLWTNLWRSRREVWAEQDLFPTLHDQQPPFAPTRTHDVFRMMSGSAGGTVVRSQSNADDLIVISAAKADGSVSAMLLNKSPMRRRVSLTIHGDSGLRAWRGQSFAVKRSDVFGIRASVADAGKAVVFVEPFSFTMLNGSSAGVDDVVNSRRRGVRSLANPASTATARIADQDWIAAALARVDRDLGAILPERVNVVFVGDSITERWLDEGRREWDAQFASSSGTVRALNLGVSGDRTEHVLHRITPRAEGGLGQLGRPGLRPDVIVVMIGTNNAFVHEPGQIIGGIRAIVEQSLRLHPTAMVVLCTLPPMGNEPLNTNLISKVNNALPKLAGLPRVQLLDLTATWTDASGRQDPAYFADDVHLNAMGYRLWSDALQSVLQGLE